MDDYRDLTVEEEDEEEYEEGENFLDDFSDELIEALEETLVIGHSDRIERFADFVDGLGIDDKPFGVLEDWLEWCDDDYEKILIKSTFIEVLSSVADDKDIEFMMWKYTCYDRLYSIFEDVMEYLKKTTRVLSVIDDKDVMRLRLEAEEGATLVFEIMHEAMARCDIFEGDPFFTQGKDSEIWWSYVYGD